MNMFSVLMSVYRNDNADDFRTAVESVTIKQTLKPDEVVLVVDGPVSEQLKRTIIDLQNEFPIIRPIWLEKNGGLGNALNIGLKECSHEIVARMDADDIAVADRFEKQVRYMESHPEVAASGGLIAEFINDPNNVVGYRKVPAEVSECRDYYQDRDPLNHMTVMLRKSAVMRVGNYLPWHLNEDSYLWGRLLKDGYEIGNIPEVLVFARVGEQMYARRGGWKYFKSDVAILKWKRENDLSSRRRYLKNYLVRFIVQVCIPNQLRGWVFRNLLRSR